MVFLRVEWSSVDVGAVEAGAESRVDGLAQAAAVGLQ